jgi:integrase
VIPLADAVVSELRKWKLRCPKTELDLVFPSKAGKPLSHSILHKLHLWPIADAAGIPRYTSHALRHCAASLWIEQRVSPKRIQRWIGHSSIQVTFDTYGHLFEQADADTAVMQAVEREVLGAPDAAQMQHGA